MKLSITKLDMIRIVMQSDALTYTAKMWALDNIDYMMRPMRLLGSSKKTEKGTKLKVVTAIMYLFPHNVISATTICAGAVLNGCHEGCLYQSGQLGMPVGRDAMAKRTVLWCLFRADFLVSLTEEIAKLYAKHGDTLAIRLNGTSDIDWSGVIKALPQVRFYDYSKIYARVLKNILPNYHLTYSGSAFSEKSQQITARAINKGLNVALAFNTKQLSGEMSVPDDLESFDDTDARFLDAPGTVGSLTRKGSSRAQRVAEETQPSFFYTEATYSNLINATNV
jgi:hypothetical protein